MPEAFPTDFRPSPTQSRPRKKDTSQSQGRNILWKTREDFATELTIGESWHYFPSNKPEQDSASLRVLKLHATILDKNTWESFFVNAHYLKRQNYFQIYGFLQTLRDPAYFGRPSNTASRGKGGGENRYSYDV